MESSRIKISTDSIKMKLSQNVKTAQLGMWKSSIAFFAYYKSQANVQQAWYVDTFASKYVTCKVYSSSVVTDEGVEPVEARCAF